MSELKAWRDVDLTAFERELLEAARSERMPAELSARVSGALSASAAAAASASVAAQGGLWFGKAGLWGVLSLLVLAGSGAYYARSIDAPRAPVPVLARAPRAAAESVTQAAANASPAAVAPVAAEPALAAVHDADTLRKEVLLLDRARVALDRDEPDGALGLLAQHRARFANGTLAPEAEALRIEALAQRGETERAQVRLERFMRAHPEHPMSERLRALAAR